MPLPQAQPDNTIYRRTLPIERQGEIEAYHSRPFERPLSARSGRRGTISRREISISQLTHDLP
jgi:hypothetical protein